MQTHSAASPGSSRRVLSWVFTQIGQLLTLVITVVIWGLLRSILQRTFRWGAFFATAATVSAGLAVVYTLVFMKPEGLRGPGVALFWGGTYGVFLLGGVVSGALSRKLGVWESQLTFYVSLALALVHLFKGWHVIFALGADPSFYAFASSVPPGESLFGPMWTRVIALAAPAAFLMMIMGGSFAYLVFGEEGRFDPGWRFEWMVARKHLAGRKGWVSVTAVVAVLGVALGVAALVAVTGVMSGYQKDVQDKILSTNAHLVVQKYGVDFEEYDKVAQDAMKVPGVLAYTPFSFNEAMLSDGDLGMGVLLKGIVPETAGDVTSIHANLCRSDTLNLRHCRQYGAQGGAEALVKMLRPQDGVASAVIGSELYKKLGLPLGGEISITTPVGVVGASATAPKRMNFRIGGVFRSGMHEFDSRLIYIHLTAAQRLMGMGSTVSGVEFRVEDPENVEAVARQVLSAVGRYPYRTLDWRELNLGIFTALKLQKIAMFLVLCAIIIVGAFNIASTLFMAVVEKSREIGVMKSIGATNASVMKIFVMEGWLVGLLGTVLGVILGLAVSGMLKELDINIAADVYMVDSLKVLISPLEVAGTAVAALAISHLATIYPALRAARQAPVDAMRYD